MLFRGRFGVGASCGNMDTNESDTMVWLVGYLKKLRPIAGDIWESKTFS
jgi:hypothetical protein